MNSRHAIRLNVALAMALASCATSPSYQMGDGAGKVYDLQDPVESSNPRLNCDSRIGLRVGEGLGVEYGYRLGDEIEIGALVEYDWIEEEYFWYKATSSRSAVAINARWYLQNIGIVEPWTNAAAGIIGNDNSSTETVYEGDGSLYWRIGIGLTLPLHERFAVEASLAVAEVGAPDGSLVSGWLGVATFF